MVHSKFKCIRHVPWSSQVERSPGWGCDSFPSVGSRLGCGAELQAATRSGRSPGGSAGWAEAGGQLTEWSGSLCWRTRGATAFPCACVTGVRATSVAVPAWYRCERVPVCGAVWVCQRHAGLFLEPQGVHTQPHLVIQLTSGLGAGGGGARAAAAPRLLPATARTQDGRICPAVLLRPRAGAKIQIR